jgi:Uma2 family endonuclease
MAESDFQRKPLTYAVDALSLYFQDRPDVYVSGNLFLYYEEGNPEAVVAPDVFVVFGTPKHDRATYQLWNEPKAPDFILEITSRSTRSKDQGPKRGTYAFLGVREYVQYDPTQDYLRPPLQGFRLVGENYEPLPYITLTDNVVVLHSEVLGLELRLDNRVLRFFDPMSGRYLLSYQEAEQARQAAEDRARQEATARQAAEARLAELEARLRDLQGPDQAETQHRAR